jgi:hypothetical protein
MWHTIHVNALLCKRVSKDFIDQVRNTYGELSNQFRVRVLGEFPLSDEDTIIPRELMELALTRDVQPLQVKPIWGLDVARSLTGDKSALAKRQGNVLLEKTQAWSIPDTMQIVGRVKHEWDHTHPPQRPSHICVDAIGYGAGVADRLREMGLPALAINVSESSPLHPEHYANLKAELWYKALDWFTARDSNLLADHELGEQLVVVQKDYTSTGKTKVEDKKLMKKRTKKPADKGDAFILTFAVDAVQAVHGSSKSIGWGVPLPKRGIGIV